jgi:hypothetical protein
MIAVALGVFEDLSEIQRTMQVRWVIWPEGIEKVSTNWRIFMKSVRQSEVLSSIVSRELTNPFGFVRYSMATHHLPSSAPAGLSSLTLVASPPWRTLQPT